MGANGAVKGRKVGIFTPEHKQLQEPYEELLGILSPVKRRASKTEGVIRTINSGAVDFWPLNDNELAGRGREYDLILVDEGGFTKDSQMMDIWRKSISPTMLTRPGAQAWVFSTPNGVKPDNFFYKICHEPGLKFKNHYAPSSTSPYVPPEELERERQDNHPQVFRQEFLAEFVDWTGVDFFSKDSLLHEGSAVPFPAICDGVFATIDTAVKDGAKHDATAVTYWAINRHVPGFKLVVLDWDIVQIEGSLLESWLPNVFRRLEELATMCRARGGSAGAFIEDKASGSILIQQSKRHGWPAHDIDSKLTAAGKDGRAINVSGYVYRGLVKISQHAFDKILTYKGAARNHFLTQVTGFRIGIDNGADDLLDTFCYGVAIGLGDSKGY